METTKNEFVEFILDMKITGVSNDVCQILYDSSSGNISLFNDLVKMGFNFSSLPGISGSVNEDIFRWFANTRNFNKWTKAVGQYAEAKPAEKAAPTITGSSLPVIISRGMRIAQTGKVNGYPRPAFKQLLQDKGLFYHDKVQYDTDYLVVVSTTTGKSKINDAAKLGTRVISIKEFMDAIGVNY